MDPHRIGQTPPQYLYLAWIAATFSARVILMIDILIRNVDDTVVAQIDREAHHLGLSRSEYLHRWLRDLTSPRHTTHADLERFSELASDLLDAEVMAKGR